jgi:hypothetical protein
MDCSVKLGSGVMIYTPSLIKIGSVIQKFIGGGGTHTDTQTARRSHRPRHSSSG